MILVILAHLQISHLNAPIQVQQILEFLRPSLGSFGVELFFVLSGFLISGLLFKEWDKSGKIQAGRFLLRRGFKIYPAFWVVLSFIIAVRLWRGYGIPLDRLTGELLFLQNYLGRLDDPHWTLAVEEHFYIILAGLFLWQSNKGSNAMGGHWIPITFIILSLCCLLSRFVANLICPENIDQILMMSHCRMDGLFSGVLLTWGCRSASWHKRFQKFQSLPIYLAIAMLACILIPIFSNYGGSWNLYFGSNLRVFIASLLILIGVNSGSTLRRPWWQALSGVGRHSYSIYLWHTPWIRIIQPYIAKYLPNSDCWWISAALGIGGSVALGRLMSEIVEKPCLRLRDYWFPSAHMPSQIISKP